MPNRIELSDSLNDVLYKLSEGNPGALTVLCRWLKEGEAIDPDACHPLIQMTALDDIDLVGFRIWLLFKDVCGESLTRFLGVLRAHQLGFITKRELVAAATTGRMDVDALDAALSRVSIRLPRFGRVEDAAMVNAGATTSVTGATESAHTSSS
jgi:hypothetical protein